MKKYIRFLTITLLMLSLFVIIGGILPRVAKAPCPRLWGKLEGSFNRDLTGWWFSSWQGEGRCRLENSKVAFKLPGSKILFGVLSPQGREPYPHLWVERGSEVIDLVCPTTDLACQNRRVFAVVDPVALSLEYHGQLNDKEKKQAEWGLQYLAGLKDVTLKAVK
ncbi:MAG: hypothetical protein EG822_13035 [Deltaproteobacteria bacterium]|nr:hypothetical protein [Deltaproteobacteria bacterium]TLN00249.1 MAG: hypothetical protein FDZ73_20000 [bacterium]